MAESTAEKKINASITSAKKAVTKAQTKVNKAKSITAQASAMAALNTAKKTLSKYELKKAGIDIAEKSSKNLAAIATKVSEHKKTVDAGLNEGKAGIWRADGGTTEVIYIAPTGGESDDTASDVSSWARDEGSPAQNYARTSAKTVTVTGIITGDTDMESRTKYNKLLSWNAHHYELMYRGRIYYKHLILTDINRTYDDYETNIKITLTFQFAYTVKVSTESGTKKTNKTSTSNKTTQGDRSKTYKTITIKSGMTYWALSKKYGKSVSWLESVNKYPARSLPIGKKIRVA